MTDRHDAGASHAIYQRRWRAGQKQQMAADWNTPPDIIALAREVLGRIDCDPASNAAAQATIGAARYFTKDTNGLRQEWHGTVWLNPPYSRGLVDQFVMKLLAERAAGSCAAAIALVNAQTSALWYHCLLRGADAVCSPHQRIRFINAATGERPDSYWTDQTFFYFGPAPERFHAVFSAVGHCDRVVGCLISTPPAVPGAA